MIRVAGAGRRDRRRRAPLHRRAHRDVPAPRRRARRHDAAADPLRPAPLVNLRSGLSAIRRGEAERIPGEYPHDIAPLASELNLLLDTNREILERARTQVGNLAHALKTPLSVIVNEAENAPADVADAGPRAGRR